MSTIRKKPYIVGKLETLSSETLTAIKNTLDISTPITTQANIRNVPSGVNPVLFTFNDTDVVSGITITNTTFKILLTFDNNQQLGIYELHTENDTWIHILEYLDVNELRRILFELLSGGGEPTEIVVTNITQLTDEQINLLKAGDVVKKKTGDQFHTYIVSYKEDGQGICLTYTDASCVETVSYDYSGGHWVYNSTDVTQLGSGGTEVEVNPDENATEDLSKIKVENVVYGVNGVNYLTTAPTGNNTSGMLKIVILDEEPVNKYDGYLYIIIGGE